MKWGELTSLTTLSLPIHEHSVFLIYLGFCFPSLAFCNLQHISLIHLFLDLYLID